jgi:tellurite resistance protein
LDYIGNTKMNALLTIEGQAMFRANQVAGMTPHKAKEAAQASFDASQRMGRQPGQQSAQARQQRLNQAAEVEAAENLEAKQRAQKCVAQFRASGGFGPVAPEDAAEDVGSIDRETSEATLKIRRMVEQARRGGQLG